MIDTIIIFCAFFIAHLIDIKIRKKIYNVDVGLAQVSAKKDFNTQSQNFKNIMDQGWKEMSTMNNFRHGIIGHIDYNIKKGDKYEILGKRTGIGTGVVLTREYVTREQIVDDMAKFYQDKKKPFIANTDELRDRFIVTMYIQESMAKFFWDDKGLYNNVDIGETVSVSYDDKGILSVGYKVKGELND